MSAARLSLPPAAARSRFRKVHPLIGSPAAVRRNFWVLGLCALFLAPQLACSQSPSPRSIESLYEEAHTAQSRGDAKDAIAKYQEILRMDAHVAPAYNNLGSLYFDTGQFTKAIQVLKDGLRIDAKMASSYAVLGSAYLALGDSTEAISALTSAVKLNRRDERSEDLLEQTLITRKQYALAADRIRNRIALSPNDQDAWYRLGEVYLQLSQQALSQAKTINPTSALAHDLEGEVQEGLGNLPHAQAQYEQAVRESPNKPGTHEHLGNVLWVQGLWSAARNEFLDELANDPPNCRVRWKLADCILNDNGSAEDALQELSTVVQQCPDLMQARVDRAKALLGLKRSEEALQDLLLAEKEEPNESSIHFLLARSYRALGRTVEAAAETEKFEEIVNRNKALPTGTKAGVAPSNTN